MPPNDDTIPPSPPAELVSTVVARGRIDSGLPELVDSLDVTIGAGQVWRAEWEGNTALIVVTDRHGDRLDVAAVHHAVEHADAWTVPVEAGSTKLGFAFGVWAIPDTTLPTLALDVFLGTVPGLVVDRVRTLRPTAPSWPDLPDSPDWMLTHPTVATRAELHRRLLGFGELRRLVDGDENTTDPGGSETLDTLLKAAGLKWSEAARTIGFAASEMRRVRDGIPGLIGPEQARQLADLLDVPQARVEGALPAGADARLRIELHRPRRRRQVRGRAARTGRSITDVREDAVRQVVGARRRERVSATTDWSALLDLYFADEPE